MFQFVNAQHQADNWYFGKRAAITFNGGSPYPVYGCQIEPLPRGMGWYLNNEGTSSISDNNGHLLFYSEGEHVWNRFNHLMPNGNNLLGCYSSTTSSFIIPVPHSDELFYLFTTDCLENGLVNGLRYSMIDMCLDSGRGDVIITQKNILLLDTVSEKLTAVNHPNGSDIWLIAHKFHSDAFYSYLITATGIIDTVISNIGSIHGPTNWQALGQMKASPDGSRIASVIGNGNVSIREIFDFDNVTGVVSNLISLTSPTFSYAVEFSPDNSKLYLYGMDLIQYDLTAGSQSAIDASAVTLTSGCLPCGMQLGPDGKIYLAGWGGNLPAITAPNLAGIGCALTFNYAPVGMNPRSDFPSFISSFEYHNGVPPCMANIPPSSDFFASDSSVCPGTCIDFSNTSFYANHYSWSFPGSNHGNDTTLNPQNICYTDTGYHDVILITTNANGSDTLIRHNFIYVYPPVTFNPILQSGNTLYSTPGFYSYQWYKDSTLIPNATLYSYVATTDGTYSVAATDDNGCLYFATILNIQVGISDIQKDSDPLQVLYDNGKICVRRNFPDDNQLCATVIDAFGKILFNEKLSFHQGESMYCINKLLASGLYLLNFTNGFSSGSTRFVIR
jgi:PKD repeat protein